MYSDIISHIIIEGTSTICLANQRCQVSKFKNISLCSYLITSSTIYNVAIYKVNQKRSMKYEGPIIQMSIPFRRTTFYLGEWFGVGIFVELFGLAIIKETQIQAKSTRVYLHSDAENAIKRC